MNRQHRRGAVTRIALVTAAASVALTTGTGPGRAASTATAYSGDAYGIGLFGVKLASGLVSISDTKLNEVGPFNAPTPQSGDSGLVAINFAALGLTAKADTARSTVTEGNSASSASSALQTASVSVGTTNLIKANVLSANTTANCSEQTAKSQVLGLTVAGQTVNVNVSPNTTVTVKQPLTGLTIAIVTINQQSSQSTATYKEATVNALVVSFPANGALASIVQGKVVISHAESDVKCATVVPPPPPPATATVSVGYVDNYNGTPFFPTPWQGDPGVVFVGTDCARGTVRTCDDGAIKVDNTSGASATVKVIVDIGPNHYDLWGDRVVPAGQSLVLTQTAPYNFDTSETNPEGCARTTTLPVVHVTVNGVTTDYSDSTQVLNTGGVEIDECPAGTNEGQNFKQIS